MSKSPNREWHFYIDDMICFAKKALAYTIEMDQETFIASEINYDATLRNLELIGEAATHIPNEIRATHPEVLGDRSLPPAIVLFTVIWALITILSGALFETI